MKRLLAAFLIGAMLVVSTACHNNKSDELDYTEEAAKPEKLVVYLSGIPSTIVPENGEARQFYPSTYTLGVKRVQGETGVEGGNVFHEALKEYAQQTGIEVEVRYLEEFVAEGKTLGTQLNNQEVFPDLLIVNKYTSFDFFALAAQNALLDFTPYMAEDKAIQDGDQYYQNVIRGGRIKDGQYVMPLLFNLPGMITSDTFLDEIGESVPSEQADYEELLQLMKRSCMAMKESDTVDALFETAGVKGGEYFLSILLGAAYGQYLDEDLKQITIAEETLAELYSLMQYYNEQEYTSILGWENMAYEELMNHPGLKRNLVTTLESEAYDKFGIFLCGGRSGAMNIHSSLLTDAAYLHSVYEENNRSMILRGIPNIEDSVSYSANVSVMAVSFPTTKYPETVYDLVRYLMDYSFIPAMGFSTNKAITQKQLEDSQKTTMTVYPEGTWSREVVGGISAEELENMTEEVQPLDTATAESIQYMLDHISGCGLPFSTLEWSMFMNMLKEVGAGNKEPEEAAKWIMEKLNEHLTLLNEIDPFYDDAYIGMLEGRK